MGMNDINSLAHTKWNCKYHIVFAPKYRRKVFYQEKREAVGKILRRLCEWKGVRIVEAEVCPDHIHMLADRTYMLDACARNIGLCFLKSLVVQNDRRNCPCEKNKE